MNNGMQNPPPGFIRVPSRSRPNEFSYWSQVLGKRFATIEVAWAAYRKHILGLVPEVSTPDPQTPEILSPLGPMRVQLAPAPLLRDSPVEPFTDLEFPPEVVSVGKTHEENPTSRLRISVSDRDSIDWVRLPDYIRETGFAGDIELFGDIEPNDLTQGIVGDCWLLATMACLAEFPFAIESLFCGQTNAAPDGQYTIRLFDLDSREWKFLVIDDFIPCRFEKDYSAVPFRIREGVKVFDVSKISPILRRKPLFAVPKGGQLWACLLEKAMAKFVGSYARLAGGHEPFAMIAFTGFPQVYQFKRPPINEEKTIAHPTDWERGWAQWAGKFSPSCGYRPILEPNLRQMSFNFVWNRLLEYDRMNYLLAASIVCYEPLTVRTDGLIAGHAYSLLSAEEWGEIRLVKLRNPHGQGSEESPTEWNGPWSDHSAEWAKHPEIADQVGHERIHDGIFWMSFSDFVTTFDKILILPFPMSEPRGALSSIRRAKVRDSHTTAVQRGTPLLGMAMEHLDADVVKAVHLMSVKPYDPYLNAPDWVTRDPAVYQRWAKEKLGK